MLDQRWRLHPQVAVRPERFGALLYHFGTRRLSFLKSPALLAVVRGLEASPSARASCERAGVPAAEIDSYAAALATLAASAMISPAPAGSAVPAAPRPVTPVAAGATGNRTGVSGRPRPLVEEFAYGLDAPICLTWELTYACNLACVHCLSSSGRRDPRELTTRQLMSVVDELEALGVFYVNIGGGEPTVRPDFEDVVDYATAHHVGVKFSTNGVRLTRGMAERIAANDYVDVQISLDGATAAVNDAVRGAGSYSTALRAMDNLAAAGLRGFKLSVVMTRHNVEQLDQFAALADHYGAQLRLTRLRPSGRGADCWDELHLTPVQQRRLYDWLLDRGESVLTGDSFFHLSGYGDPLPGLNLCGAGRVVCLIDPIGDVYACPFAIHPAFLAGRVTEPGGFTRVWRESELFGGLRRPSGGGACTSCSAWESCRGGCPAAKFFTGLPLDGPDPECVRGHGERALAAVDRPAAPRSPVDHSRPGPVPITIGRRPDRACDTSPVAGLAAR